MPIVNPTQLVDEFKKSGEFDRLRRDLLAEFQGGDSIASFKSRIQEIARDRLNTDEKLKYASQDAMHRELMQEIDRFPIIERSITADVHLLTDPSFAAGIRRSAQRILSRDRGQKTESSIALDGPPQNAMPSQSSHNLPTGASKTDPASLEALPQSLPTDSPLVSDEAADSDKMNVNSVTESNVDRRSDTVQEEQ